MANAWFETVAEAQRRAQKRLPKSVYGALVAGSEKGLSSRDNLDSFDQLGFAPHIAGLSGQRDMAVSVMGQQLAMPVIISPTGVQAVHPEGEVAIARAAQNRGIPTVNSFPISEAEAAAAAAVSAADFAAPPTADVNVSTTSLTSSALLTFSTSADGSPPAPKIHAYPASPLPRMPVTNQRNKVELSGSFLY